MDTSKALLARWCISLSNFNSLVCFPIQDPSHIGRPYVRPVRRHRPRLIFDFMKTMQV